MTDDTKTSAELGELRGEFHQFKSNVEDTLRDIRGDVKSLLAYQAEQQGRHKLAVAFTAAVITLMGVVIGWFSRHLGH